MSSRPSFECPQCHFALWLPLAELELSTLGLYDDARFPGRCILALNAHHDDLVDLDDHVTLSFMRDVRQAALAIKRATNAKRVNIAFLGNAVPHVHAHLIPRVPGGDPVPDRAPWAHPEQAHKMTAQQRDKVSRSIVRELRTARVQLA